MITMPNPVTQTDPQQNALDKLLDEQLGYSLIEGETSDDYLPGSPVARLDPNAMVASLTGKGARIAVKEAVKAAREGMAHESPEAAAKAVEQLPEKNPFAQSMDDPQAMADPTVAPTAETEIPQDAMGMPSLKPTEIEAIGMQESMRTMQPVEGGRNDQRNMSFNFIDDQEDRKLAELINRGQQGFKAIPERKVQTHAETLRLAETRQTMEKVLNKKVDERWEPQELSFLQLTIRSSTTRLNEMSKQIAQQVREGGADVVDGKLLTQFDLLMKRNIAAQQTASGVLSQAGRLLNASQAVNKAPSGNEYYKRVAESMELSGGRDAIIQRALNIEKSGGTEAEVAGIVRQTWQEKAWNAALKVRYNMMLSSARSHVANLGSSQMLAVMEALPYKASASAFNYGEYLFRSVVPGFEPLKPEERVKFLAELPAATSGYLVGARDGFRTAKQIASGEIVGDGKFMNEMGIRYAPDEVPQNALLRAGTIPTRLLEAEDAFNKSVLFNMRIRELAYRNSQGAENQEQAYQELLANPTETMMDEASAFAKKGTFTNDPNQYGKLIGATANWVAEGTTNIPALKVLIPFVKTPANIMGYAFETTGIGQALNAGDTYNKFINGTPAERADVAGRMQIAAGLWATLYAYWQEGKITGMGSDSPVVNASREATGWQENSIKVGDKYYSLNRADPMGMTLAIMASGFDAFENETNGNQMATTIATVLSVAEIAKDRSYLTGITDLIDVLDSGSLKSAESLAASQAATFVLPNFLRDIREGADPYKREQAFDPNSGMTGIGTRFEKYIKNAVPGMSATLPPALDVNGKDKTSAGQWYWRALVPVRVTEVEKQDPVAAVYMYHKTPVEKPDYMITIPGTGGVQINTLMMDGQKGWLYYEYQKQVGNARHELVTEFLKSPAWKKLVKDGNYGAGSQADEVIRGLVADGKKLGTYRFLESIAGQGEYQPVVGGKKIGEPIKLESVYTKEDLKFFAKATSYSAKDYDLERLQQMQETNLYKKPKRNPLESFPESERGMLDKSVEF